MDAAKPPFVLLFLSFFSFCTVTITTEHSNYQAINFPQDPFRVACAHHPHIQNKKPLRRIQFGQRLNPEDLPRNRGDRRKRLPNQERSGPIKTFQWRRPEPEPRRDIDHDNVSGETRSEHVRAFQNPQNHHGQFGERTVVSNEASWPGGSHYHVQGPTQQRVQLKPVETNPVFLSTNRNPESSYDQEELAFVVDFGKGETIRVHGNPNSKKLHLESDNKEKNKETVSNLLRAILQNREGASVKINGEKYKTRVFQHNQEQEERIVGQASQIQESRSIKGHQELKSEEERKEDQTEEDKKPRRFKYGIKNKIEDDEDLSNEEDSVSLETSQDKHHSYHYKIKEVPREKGHLNQPIQTRYIPQVTQNQPPFRGPPPPVQPYRFGPPFEAHNAFFNTNGFFAQPQVRHGPPQTSYGGAFPRPPQFAYDSLSAPFTKISPLPQIHAPGHVQHQPIPVVPQPNPGQNTHHGSRPTQPHHKQDPFHGPQVSSLKANVVPTSAPVHFVSSTQQPQGKPFTIVQHTPNHTPAHYGSQQHHSNPTRKSHSYVFQQFGTGPSSMGFSFNLDNGKVDQESRNIVLGSRGHDGKPHVNPVEVDHRPVVPQPPKTTKQPVVMNQPTVSSLPRLHIPPPQLSKSPRFVQKPLVVLKPVPLEPEPQPEPKIIRHRTRKPRRRKNKSRQPKVEFTSTTAVPLSILSPVHDDESADDSIEAHENDQDLLKLSTPSISTTTTTTTTATTRTTTTSVTSPQQNGVFFIVSTSTPGTVIQAFRHKASNPEESSPLVLTPTGFLSTLAPSVTPSQEPIVFSSTPAVPDLSPFPQVTGSGPNQFSVTTTPVVHSTTTTQPQGRFAPPSAFPQPIISSTGSPGIRSKPLRPRTQPTTTTRSTTERSTTTSTTTTATTTTLVTLKITGRSKIIKIKNFRKSNPVEQFRTNLLNRARVTTQSTAFSQVNTTPQPIQTTQSGSVTPSNNLQDREHEQLSEGTSSNPANQATIELQPEGHTTSSDLKANINNLSDEFEDSSETPLPFEGFSIFDEPITIFGTTPSQPTTNGFESTRNQPSTGFTTTHSQSTSSFESTQGQLTTSFDAFQSQPTTFESPQSQPTTFQLPQTQPTTFDFTQNQPQTSIASTTSQPPTFETAYTTAHPTPSSIPDSTTYYPVSPSAKPLSILDNTIIDKSSTESQSKFDSDLVLLEPHFVKPTLATEGVELEAKIHNAYKDQKFVGETVPPTASTNLPTTTSIPKPAIIRTRFRSTMEPTSSPISVTSSTTARSSTERTSRKFFRSRRPLNRQNFIRNKIEEPATPESKEVPNSSTEMTITRTKEFESLRTNGKNKVPTKGGIEIFNGVSVVQIPAHLKRQPEAIVIEPIFEEVPTGSNSVEDSSTQQAFTVVIEEDNSVDSSLPVRIRPTFSQRPTTRKGITVKKKRPRPLVALRRPVVRNPKVQKETVRTLLKNLRKHRQKIKARKEILKETAQLESREVTEDSSANTIAIPSELDSTSIKSELKQADLPMSSTIITPTADSTTSTKFTATSTTISATTFSTTTATTTTTRVEIVTEAVTSPFTTPDSTTLSSTLVSTNSTTITTISSPQSTTTTATTTTTTTSRLEEEGLSASK